ncbi:TatD family hydrolase, partial [Acinetobacter baumannii]
MHLFDTHTHFDVADFDEDRQQLALEAKKVGVDALVLIGFLQSRFDDLVYTHHQLKQWEKVPASYLAPGLHPFYIEQHRPEHLSHLEQILQQEDCVAVGEIGLDTFLKE